MTSPHRAREVRGQRDALDWQMARGDPAEPRPTHGTERRGDERHGSGGYRVSNAARPHNVPSIDQCINPEAVPPGAAAIPVAIANAFG
jgi:hypothetical protein